MKRRFGKSLLEASEEKVWKERRSLSVERPRSSGLTDEDIKWRYIRRKQARETGDLNEIRWAHGAPALGRVSQIALGWIKAAPKEPPAEN